MPEERSFLGLGSNLGDRRAQLCGAVAALRALAPLRLGRCSALYETQPWGKRDQEPFLNCALELTTQATPRELLGWLQALEARAGRVPEPPGERWGPRTLDLDILLIGERVIREPTLCVPHPHLHERRFVLVPLVEIAPEVTHPVLKKTLRELLEACPDDSAVRRA